MEDKKVENAIAIDVPANKVRGSYVNMVLVSNSMNEFTLDMVHVLPPGKQGVFEKRIIMAPTAAKMFAKQMSEAVKNYEKDFGVIELPLTTQHMMGAGGKA